VNAQASFLWLAELAKTLQASLDLPCSVEPRPLHVCITVDAETWLAIGDANGPIGFDITTAAGEAGAFHESERYIGDDVATVARELLPLLKLTIARTPRACLAAAGFTVAEVESITLAEEWEDAYISATHRLQGRDFGGPLTANAFAWRIVREAIAHVAMSMADDASGCYLGAVREVCRE
jgi:hypothetical protein